LTDNWIRIDVNCRAEISDILAAEFAEIFGSTVEYTSGGIRIYMDSARYAVDKVRLEHIVASLSKAAGSLPIRLDISEIPDQDWSRSWKEHFKPLKIGRRFLVSPTWEKASDDPERFVILIDPGRAFGTGHHETTRLCLEWLESCGVDSSGKSLLDIGTGSGILAIGASLLGFQTVVGIDIDHEAIEVAKENVVLNGKYEKILLFCASPEGAGGLFDIVISNIELNPLKRMSETVCAKVRDGGLLALSGILAEQADELRAVYEQRSMRLMDTKKAGEWVLLAFSR